MSTYTHAHTRTLKFYVPRAYPHYLVIFYTLREYGSQHKNSEN